MKIFLVVILILLSSATAYSEGRLWQCKIRSAITLNDEGGLGPTDFLDNLTADLSTFTFDETSGLLRWGSIPEYYDVQLLGDDKNSTHATEQGRYDRYLQIRTWLDTKPFLWYRGEWIISGVCQRL